VQVDLEELTRLHAWMQERGVVSLEVGNTKISLLPGTLRKETAPDLPSDDAPTLVDVERVALDDLGLDGEGLLRLKRGSTC